MKEEGLRSQFNSLRLLSNCRTQVITKALCLKVSSKCGFPATVGFRQLWVIAIPGKVKTLEQRKNVSNGLRDELAKGALTGMSEAMQTAGDMPPGFARKHMQSEAGSVVCDLDHTKSPVYGPKYPRVQENAAEETKRKTV